MNPLKLNTTSVSLAVTPTVVSTLLSHYLNRQPLKQKPTAHLSYDEGLHLVKSFLQFASHHTVEELQAFTAQWVPHPQWVRVDEITIADQLLEKAAALLQAELGEEGIARVGGRQWWQWRRPKSPLKAEWIEMKAHYQERKKNGDPGKRVMLYVHGGAYFFGSVDEHRYQMQRHARKLKARVFAPKYRLAPQFPFPCGLQDCIAAYLYLLTIQEPNTIILAGDSAGGGMVMSMLCTLRDQGIPLPAGAILISPWVDLTHSFPSVAGDTPFDYIPTSGFHHKPSRAWPPPNEDDLAMMEEQAAKKKKGDKGAAKPSTLEAKQGNPFELETPEGHDAQGDPIAKPEAPLEADVPKTSVLLSVTINGKLTTVKDQIQGDPIAKPEAPLEADVPKTSVLLSVTINGKLTTVKDQIQMYTTNQLIDHPLVSPVTQPTLGGLPPLLIMVGGGEVLRVG
ncbi:AB hydrolase superfamily protein C4A8.06c like [Verticillium longisporum]|nr:AB hydrolase superfamily protein C4A8.06c like [Verticillium longisporum]